MLKLQYTIPFGSIKTKGKNLASQYMIKFFSKIIKILTDDNHINVEAFSIGWDLTSPTVGSTTC